MKNKADVIFLGIVFILAISVFFGYKLIRRSDSANCFTVSIDGKEYTYDITPGKEEGYVFTSDDPVGSQKENVVRVNADGSVQMESANCPDKTCVHQGKIRHNNETIVCLPHKVIVRLKNNSNKIDTVAQ